MPSIPVLDENDDLETLENSSKEEPICQLHLLIFSLHFIFMC